MLIPYILLFLLLILTIVITFTIFNLEVIRLKCLIILLFNNITLIKGLVFNKFITYLNTYIIGYYNVQVMVKIGLINLIILFKPFYIILIILQVLIFYFFLRQELLLIIFHIKTVLYDLCRFNSTIFTLIILLDIILKSIISVLTVSITYINIFIPIMLFFNGDISIYNTFGLSIYTHTNNLYSTHYDLIFFIGKYTFILIIDYIIHIINLYEVSTQLCSTYTYKTPLILLNFCFLLLILSVLCFQYLYWGCKKNSLYFLAIQIYKPFRKKLFLLYMSLLGYCSFYRSLHNNFSLCTLTYLWVLLHYFISIIFVTNYLVTQQSVHFYINHIFYNTDVELFDLYNPYTYYISLVILCNSTYIICIIIPYILLLVLSKFITLIFKFYMYITSLFISSLRTFICKYSIYISDYRNIYTYILFMLRTWNIIWSILLYSIKSVLNLVVLSYINFISICIYIYTHSFNFIFIATIQISYEFMSILDHFIRAVLYITTVISYLVIKYGYTINYPPIYEINFHIIHYYDLLLFIPTVIILILSLLSYQDLNSFNFDICYREPRNAIIWRLNNIDMEVIIYNENIIIIVLSIITSLFYIKIITFFSFCIGFVFN